MKHDTIAGLPGAIARIGAFLLITASAACGTYYGFHTGAHFNLGLGVIFALAALGGELLKPFAMEAAVARLKRLDLLSALPCLAVAFVCIGYSLASELALSAGSRGDAAAERTAAAQAAGDARETAKATAGKRQRAEAELATLKPTKAVAELELLDRRHPGRDCGAENGTGRWVCQKAGPYAGELARAKRRAELEAAIAGTLQPPQAGAAGPSTSRAVGEADPLAAAVSGYLGDAGVTVSAEPLARWLYLVPVIFLEIGSAFGLVVAGAVATIAQPVSVATGPETVAIPASVASVRTLAAPNDARAVVEPRAIVASTRTIAAVRDRCSSVRAALHAAGRPLSNIELAATMGVHPSTASRHVARLQMMGLVSKVQAGREVVISLVH